MIEWPTSCSIWVWRFWHRNRFKNSTDSVTVLICAEVIEISLFMRNGEVNRWVTSRPRICPTVNTFLHFRCTQLNNARVSKRLRKRRHCCLMFSWLFERVRRRKKRCLSIPRALSQKREAKKQGEWRGEEGKYGRWRCPIQRITALRQTWNSTMRRASEKGRISQRLRRLILHHTGTSLEMIGKIGSQCISRKFVIFRCLDPHFYSEKRHSIFWFLKASTLMKSG